MADIGNNAPYTFDRVVRILGGVLLLGVAVYLLNFLKGVLLPFFVAWLIAYMLEPVVKWNIRWMHCRTLFLPLVFTLVEVTAVFGAILAVTVPYIMSECSEMGKMLRTYANTQIHLPWVAQQVHDFIKEHVNFEYIASLLSREQWIALLKETAASSWNVLSSGLTFVLELLSWLIVFLYLIFIMIDYERLSQSFRHLVPGRHRHRVFKIFDDVKSAMNRYFRGQFIIAMSVGVLFAIGFWIIGLPMGVLLGLFIGMLNMVPYLQLISLPITLVLCIVATAGGANFWVILGASIAVYLVVQCIQDLILTPKIMGHAMGLNPAIILLSLSVWGSLLGFMGLIIALPLTTLVLSYYDMYVLQRLKRKSDRESIEKIIHEENPAQE